MAHYILAVVTGHHTFAGSTATLRRTRNVVPVQGAYALSPQATTFRRGRWLVAVQGAYASQPGGWLALGMPAFKGSYAAMGNSTTLAAHLSLQAASGAYASTGRQAILAYTPATVSPTGQYGFGPGVGTLLTQTHPP